MSVTATSDYRVERDLGLYEVELDGCEKYWIAARGPYQAIELLKTCEPDDGELCDLTVEQLNEKLASKKSFHDDDGTTLTMWEAFQKQTEPGIVASTLY